MCSSRCLCQDMKQAKKIRVRRPRNLSFLLFVARQIHLVVCNIKSKSNFGMENRFDFFFHFVARLSLDASVHATRNRQQQQQKTNYTRFLQWYFYANINQINQNNISRCTQCTYTLSPPCNMQSAKIAFGTKIISEHFSLVCLALAKNIFSNIHEKKATAAKARRERKRRVHNMNCIW